MQKAQTGISLSETIREIESYRSEVNTSIIDENNMTNSYQQVDALDVDDDEEKYVANTDYEQPYYNDEDDDDCYEEDNNQNDYIETSSENSIYNSIVKFVNKMFEEED
jgi:hypothetical protein